MSNYLIYLASPYNHPDVFVRHKRYVEALSATTKLFASGHHVYSPIVHNHYIELMIGSAKSRSWAYWRNYDLCILQRCNELKVLTIQGWDSSVGVEAEIEFAKSNDIRVSYMPGVVDSFDLIGGAGS